MIKLYTTAFTVILSFFILTSVAQNIKSEDITYYYFRLPLQPLGKSIRNYQVKIDAPYEAKNQELLKEYNLQKKQADDKYKKEMAEYPALLKAAEARYEKELAEYNKKTVGQKWVEKKILEENNKPVKELPSKPYEPTVAKPFMQTSYDYNILANTYLNLEGFDNKADNALKVLVTMYGFDYTQPRVLGEQAAINSTALAYHNEFSYRHPMAVKVTMPDGKEILSLTPPELNIYKMYKTNATTGQQQVNNEAVIKSNEAKILQDNLLFVNNLLNSRYSFSKVKRTAPLYFVKNKQEEYVDLTTAFNEASSALQMMEQDTSAAKVKLQKSIDLWNAALKESDPTNRKARIDKDVTIAIAFNLLEAYFATGNTEGGKAILEKLNTINLPSNERKTKNDYELLFADLKTRQQNNK